MGGEFIRVTSSLINEQALIIEPTDLSSTKVLFLPYWSENHALYSKCMYVITC